jgi:hypothetical protein
MADASLLSSQLRWISQIYYWNTESVSLPLSYYTPTATPFTIGNQTNETSDQEEMRNANGLSVKKVPIGQSLVWKTASGNWKPAKINTCRLPKKKSKFKRGFLRTEGPITNLSTIKFKDNYIKIVKKVQRLCVLGLLKIILMCKSYLLGQLKNNTSRQTLSSEKISSKIIGKGVNSLGDCLDKA